MCFFIEWEEVKPETKSIFKLPIGVFKKLHFKIHMIESRNEKRREGRIQLSSKEQIYSCCTCWTL